MSFPPARLLTDRARCSLHKWAREFVNEPTTISIHTFSRGMKCHARGSFVLDEGIRGDEEKEKHNLWMPQHRPQLLHTVREFTSFAIPTRASFHKKPTKFGFMPILRNETYM